MNSLPPNVKVPKTPRPERASILSCAVARGLKDSIASTRQDLLSFRKAQHDYKMARSQGRVYEMDKQIKAAERYLKRLEFLLSQIEDLHDQYSLNQRLRDGVRTMAYAYALSPGKEKASALSNVRSGYKECTETLCSLEVQIEQLIGTLTLEMKGIQGFARLCPGDVFEVVIKHGSQKWKSRGRVNKDNSQSWDNSVFVFKALIGEMLMIKAMEVRLLGKTVTIGSKICETKDLFAPHPQLMTVNLNPSGSLKLNLIITWNPLDGGSEETLTRTPSISGASPRGRKKSVIPSVSSSPPQYSNFLMPSSSKELVSPECDHDSSFGSMSARSSTTDSASPLSEYRDLPSSQAALSTRADSNSPVSDIQALVLSRRNDSQDSIIFDERDSSSPHCDESGNFTLVRKEQSRVAQWARYSQYNAQAEGSQIDIMSRSFPNLSTQLQSGSGSHTQRFSPVFSHLSYSLSHQLNLLAVPESESSKWNETMVWDCSVPNSLPKVINRLKTCLEDIQGQFPQLHSLEEAVLDLHDMCRYCRSRKDSNTSEISLSVESALECFDFLNAECDDDFGDDNPEECLVKNQKESLVCANAKDSSDPIPPLVTGSPQLDTFLLVHLKHSLQLMPDLGKYGPLRMKEKESLTKLEKEGDLLSKVLMHKHNFDGIKPQQIIPLPHTQVLWDSVVIGDNWCTTGKEVVNGLMPLSVSLVESESEAKELPMRVLEELVRQITDSDIYSDCLTVTVGHFIDHLHRPIQEILPETASSLICTDLLQHGNAKSVEEALRKLSSKVPPINTKLLSHLAFNSSEVSLIVLSFLRQRTNDEQLLISIYSGCLLLLESVNPCDRSSACEMLGMLAPLLPNSFLKEQQLPPATGDAPRKSFLSLIPQGEDTSKDVSKENKRILDKKTKDDSNKDQQINDQMNKIKDLSIDHSMNDKMSRVKDLCSDLSDQVNKRRNSKVSSDSQPMIILSYICQNDHSEAVRESAKLALMNLGAVITDKFSPHSQSLLSQGFVTHPELDEREND